jgi:probable HAF family extracellular repeat protein
MKSRTLTCITAMTLFVALVVPVWLAAQDRAQEKTTIHHHYKLIDVGTFGGPSTFIMEEEQMLLNNGTLTGESDTSIPDPYAPNCFVAECFVQHAFRWQDGVLTDLGALPGGSSSNSNWINSRGWIAGISQNGVIDPLTGGPEIRAVLWRDTEIIDLGTLGGGNESGAFGVNDGGQVAGAATNAVPDPFSFGGLGTQLRAFLWKNGVMQDLGTLGGPDAFAQFINKRGQVAGFSYTSFTPASGGVPQIDPFLWDNGRMIDLGNFGGTNAGTSGLIWGLNNRGQVIGYLNLPGDQATHPFLWDHGKLTDLGTFGGSFGQPNWINDAGDTVGFAFFADNLTAHAALWTNGQIHDLGTLPGHQGSGADAINSEGQIVGESNPGDITKSSAVLWENGSIVDLNSLVAPNSGLHLEGAHAINDRGEIECDGFLPNGHLHAILLIPCAEGDESCQDRAGGAAAAIQSSPASVTQRPPTATSVNPALSGRGMLERLRARRFPWYHVPGPGTAPPN